MAGEVNLRFTIGMQKHLLILDCSPQSLSKDVVVVAISSRLADPDSVSVQPGNEVGKGELASLV